LSVRIVGDKDFGALGVGKAFALNVVFIEGLLEVFGRSKATGEDEVFLTAV
jgi:hypothetical protein